MKLLPVRFRDCVCSTAVALLLAVASTAGAGGEPQPRTPPRETPMTKPLVAYTAKYKVIASGATVGEAVYTLARSGQNWEFRAHARPSGMVSIFLSTEIEEYSRLEAGAASVLPLQYRHEQATDKEQDRQILEADYDWRAGSLTVSNGTSSRKIALMPGTHDPLSAQLAVIQCIKNGCDQMDYRVLDEMELQQRRFERDGTETVKTPLGDYDCVKVSYRRGKRQTVMWLAPALNYVPVKIQQFKNAEPKSEMRISSVTFE